MQMKFQELMHLDF